MSSKSVFFKIIDTTKIFTNSRNKLRTVNLTSTAEPIQYYVPFMRRPMIIASQDQVIDILQKKCSEHKMDEYDTRAMRHIICQLKYETPPFLTSYEEVIVDNEFIGTTDIGERLPDNYDAHMFCGSITRYFIYATAGLSWCLPLNIMIYAVPFAFIGSMFAAAEKSDRWLIITQTLDEGYKYHLSNANAIISKYSSVQKPTTDYTT